MNEVVIQILKNQLAIMDLLKQLDWKLSMTTDAAYSIDTETWEHSINRPMQATRDLLSNIV